MSKLLKVFVALVMVTSAVDFSLSAATPTKTRTNQPTTKTAAKAAVKSTVPSWLIGTWILERQGCTEFLEIKGDKIYKGVDYNDGEPTLMLGYPFVIHGDKLVVDGELSFFIDNKAHSIFGPCDENSNSRGRKWNKRTRYDDECIEAEEIEEEVFFTEILIVEDDKVNTEVKTQEELYDESMAMCSKEEQSGGVGQTSESFVIEVPAKNTEVSPAQGNMVYNFATVEQRPSFPGGDAAMYKWINTHLIYPKEAAQEGVAGRVVVSLIIDVDGSISDVTVVRGKHPALDREAVRVVSSMPEWIPGRNNGVPVKTTYMLPVTFVLQ